MPPLKCVLAWLACTSAGATSVKKWRVLGPFPIGKNELDGEPWHLSNVSELVGGGYASWKRFASREDVLVVDWQDVDWEGLIQGTGGHEVLEWQALALGSFAVPEHGQVSVSCQGVSAFRIDDRQMPFVGDQYRVGLPGYSVDLKRGNHRISIRLRAKHRAVLRCEVESVQLGPYRPQLYAGDSVTVPDVYEGFLAGGLVGLPVFNVHPTEWLRDVRPVVTGRGFNASLSSVATLAPNQRLRLPLRVELTERGCPKGRFRVAVEGKLRGEVLRSTPLTVSLRCREQGQSFVFTFLDADGSVQQAAAVAPSSWCNSGCPVLINLAGTSISPSDSADSYKVKLGGDAEFRFGVAGAWLLAPHRAGAHNWEGPGRLTAVSALHSLDAVATALERPVDVARVLCAGHSMGGHGAWLLAVTFRDQLLGLVSSASWLRKDQYADSNKVFLNDVSVPDVEPALAVILRSAESEHDADAHASTVAGGLPVLARVGSRDRTVHPWFTRRMVRGLLAAGATTSEVTLTEVPGKEHWWWDTERPNDGGAVNDDEMRAFFAMCLGRAPGVPSLPAEWRLVVYNVATAGRKGGARILQQLVPHRRTELLFSASGGVLHVSTSNIRSLEWDAVALRSLARVHGALGDRGPALILDGQQVDTSSNLVFCQRGHFWITCSHDLVDRGPETTGPMRQLFAAPVCAVFGDGDALGAETAIFVANMIAMTGSGYMRLFPSSQVMDETFLSPPEACRHLFVIGGQNVNPAAASLLRSQPALGYTPPIHAEVATGISSVSVGPCMWSGENVAAVALLPWWSLSDSAPSPRLALLATGLPEAVAQAVSLLGTPTVPPMTRQPFTQLLPDFVVLDVQETLVRGAGGFLAAGFWGSRWDYEPRSSWESSCRVVAKTAVTPHGEL